MCQFKFIQTRFSPSFAMDPGEESFTLSSFDFNSSFALYSSDDDDQDRTTYDTYIELELGSAASGAQQGPGSDGSDIDDELRISFSAVVPFPGFFPSSIVSSKQLFSTCEGPNARVTPAVDSSPEDVVESTPVKRRLKGDRTVRLFPLAWTRFPPSVDHDYPHINGWDLVTTRKASPAVNGGITKLLVKLRSIIISGFGSMRALAQVGNQAHPNSARLTSIKPFERWLALCKPSQPPQRVAAVRTNGGSSSEVRTSLKVTEMKFETMRKLFGSAVRQIKNNGSKSNRMNKSCPTSVKSSPVHQLGDASLVHAAIAHCKKSFGQSDDFSF